MTMIFQQYMIKARILACCLLACFIFWGMTIQPCMATGPDHLSLRGFTVLEEQDQLVLRAPIDIEPREAMRHMLRDGAQVLLTCTASLERERTLLPRSTVATSTAAMVLSYDPLSRQYILSLALPEELEYFENSIKSPNEDLGEVEGTSEQNLTEEKQLQERFVFSEPLYSHREFDILMDNTLGRLRLPLCSTDILEAEEDYYATLRVELRHNRVPPWLSQALFFWSWEVVPSIEFSQALRGD